MPIGGQAPASATIGAGTQILLARQIYQPASLLNAFATSTFADVDATNAAITFDGADAPTGVVRVDVEFEMVLLDSGFDFRHFIALFEGTTQLTPDYQVGFHQAAAPIHSVRLHAEFWLTGVTAASHTYTLRQRYGNGDGTGSAAIQAGNDGTNKAGPLQMVAYAFTA